MPENPPLILHVTLVKMTEMNNLTLIDENFNIQKTMSYHISIQVGTSGYSLCILDTLENKYIVLKNVNFPERYSLENQDKETLFYDKIKEVIGNDEFLQKDYKSVKFIFLTKKATIVPSELFEITRLKHYFDFNQILLENESVNYAKLENINAYSVFALPSFLTTIIINRFRNLKFYQQSIPFVEYITGRTYKMRNAANQKNVYVNCYSDFFDLFVADASGLLLHNSFTYQNENDIIYHIINVYKQLDLSLDVSALFLAGENTEINSPVYTNLRKYIRNIKYMTTNPVFKYSKMFGEIPEQLFVNLFNLYTCV